MSDDQIVTLNGKITYVLFQNEHNFYTVARFLINDEKEKTITITGNMPGIEPGVLYRITGTYVEHPKYGMQFAVKYYEKPLPTEEEGIINYLSSVRFPGVGRKTAEKVVQVLGSSCLEEIKADPDVLKQIPGLNEKAIDSIIKGIQASDDGMEELVKFLNVNGIGMQNLIRLNKAYGKEALQKIRENPYRVIDECDGFGFKTADKMAKAMDISSDDPRRLYAFLVSLVMDLCMSSGNSFILEEDLEQAYYQKTKGIESDFSELLDEAVMKRSLIREEDRIYPKSQYEAETTIAYYLNHFPFDDMHDPDDELMDQYLKHMEKDIGITYNDKQVEAIHSFFHNPFMILTGGPGTGKTTVVRAMVTLFRLLYPEYEIVCAAPTGRAAKRLSELTDTGTTTIHSLLAWDLETNTFGKNEKEPIHADLLIIDEFSMVDSYLFSALCKAARHVKKICVIGDEDQLPSVGPGSVLRDLISSKQFPLVRLNHIYRQKDGSGVIQLAHDIRNGTVDFDNYKEDVAFLECDSTRIKNTVVSIIQTAVNEKGYDFNDIQVLSPMYAGNAGIDVLNHALQDTFNPASEGKREVRYGYQIFREGDRILQLRNQPDDDIYNGDIGILSEIIDAKESEDHKTTVVVDFQDNFVEYTTDNLDHITLAYCISIHKSQGSEYPIVIMPFTKRHAVLLTRKLIYTGATRAKKALVLLGEKDAFLKGIDTLERRPRETTLAMRFKKPQLE